MHDRGVRVYIMLGLHKSCAEVLMLHIFPPDVFFGTTNTDYCYYVYTCALNTQPSTPFSAMSVRCSSCLTSWVQP